MIINSTSFSVHTFLNIATVATGSMLTVDVLYACIYVHIMHVCIYGFMYILNLAFC